MYEPRSSAGMQKEFKNPSCLYLPALEWPFEKSLYLCGKIKKGRVVSLFFLIKAHLSTFDNVYTILIA